MNIEEKLWEYIDGGGTAVQRAEVEHLLASNVQARQQYEELLQLHAEFGQVEADEPSMAFTYNVMETIRMEQAAVPLKAGINRRVIWTIAAFFIVSLGASLIAMLWQINWQFNGASQVTLPDKVPVNVNSFNNLLSGPLAKGLAFFAVVFGLFLFDAWLRRNNESEKRQTI